MREARTETKRPNAARIVSEALLGLDFRNVVVAGRVYQIDPPTVRRLAGAALHLSGVAETPTIKDFVLSQEKLESVAKALSWLVCGSEQKWKEMSRGTPEELADALEAAYSLVSPAPFMRLSTFARSVASLTARQRR
ncbi:MAG: hypothetical protein LUI09_08385 [Prevotellaceae bacterium]|nr:hypothetical protein [Prevotellaceae bacterium]